MPYPKHVKRRNGIVHRGAKATSADASDSIDIARQFVAHLESVIAAASSNT